MENPKLALVLPEVLKAPKYPMTANPPMMFVLLSR
jgi:hypothetical protein